MPGRMRVHCDGQLRRTSLDEYAVLVRDLAFDDERAALRVDCGTEADDAPVGPVVCPACGRSIGWPTRIFEATRSGISARTRTGCWRTRSLPAR